MRKSFVKPIIFVFGISSVILFFFFYTENAVKLPVPKNPPQFSVSYLYYFSWQNPGERVSAYEEIDKDIKGIKDAGFDGIKVNFYFQEDNTISNRVVNVAAKNNIYPIGQLTGHNQKPKERAFTEDELLDWEDFVRTEVRKNKDTIYYWEVWNEPNMTELKFRYGTPVQYIELLRRSVEIIKSENPNAKIIVTSDYTDTESQEFTNEFLQLGGSEYIDYLSFHPYNAITENPRYTLEETISAEKELSEKYGKPLWITEIGHPDSDSSESVQSEVALRLLQLAYTNSIPIVWFHWSDERVSIIDGKTGWGLVRQDESYKPSYFVVKDFIAGTK